MTFALLFIDECDSTQRYAKSVLRDDDFVVTSKVQTAGRGRAGRPWLHTDGALLSTFVVTPRLPAQKCTRLPFMMAHALFDVLRAMGETELTFKWPNDLFLRGKKVAGILVELSAGRAYIGVGVNCGRAPEGDFEASAAAVNAIDLLTRLAARFNLAALTDDRAFARTLAVLSEHSSTLGQEVSVAGIDGRALCYDTGGALIVENASGRHTVMAGDVAFR